MNCNKHPRECRDLEVDGQCRWCNEVDDLKASVTAWCDKLTESYASAAALRKQVADLKATIAEAGDPVGVALERMDRLFGKEGE